MFQDLYPVLSLLFTLIGGQFALGVWINSQFASMRKEFTSQLQYHERHDDRRFGEINNAIWELLRLQSRGSVDEKDFIPRKRRTPDPG